MVSEGWVVFFHLFLWIPITGVTLYLMDIFIVAFFVFPFLSLLPLSLSRQEIELFQFGNWWFLICLNVIVLPSLFSSSLALNSDILGNENAEFEPETINISIDTLEARSDYRTKAKLNSQNIKKEGKSREKSMVPFILH